MEVAIQHLEPLLFLLRPYLTPLIASLPAPAVDFGVSQLGPECYDRIITNLDLSSLECTKLTISKTLGVGIVSMAAFVKIPQLLKLLSSRSARGVSFASYLLETIAYVITLAYNVRQANPLSTYGEIAILAVQNVVVSLLVLEYGGRRAAAAVFVAAMAAGTWALFDPQTVDMDMMRLAQAATIPLGLAAKVPQIWTIAKAKTTGQLSAFAIFNYLLGSLARVFTTLAEVDDPIILYGYLGGVALNFVLAAQMVYYWNSGTKLAAKPKKHYPPTVKKAGGGRKKA